MVRAVIVSTARTGLAKSFRGGFNLTHGAALAGHALKSAIDKAGIDSAAVEDVILGCVLLRMARVTCVACSMACVTCVWRDSSSPCAAGVACRAGEVSEDHG